MPVALQLLSDGRYFSHEKILTFTEVKESSMMNEPPRGHLPNLVSFLNLAPLSPSIQIILKQVPENKSFHPSTH